MNRKLFIIILVMAIIPGSSSKTKMGDTTPRVRKLKAQEVTEFHKNIVLKVGWYPYEEAETLNIDPSVWAVSFSDSSKIGGAVPVIIVSYPDSGYALTLGMDVDDALLGKLLKHSLMTEIPIKRPFTDFLQKADCSKCHPSNIKINQ